MEGGTLWCRWGGVEGGWEGLRKDTHNTGCAYSGWSSHWVTKLLPCEPITGQWLEARDSEAVVSSRACATR